MSALKEDQPGIEERVGKALARGDMRQRPSYTTCDLDKVAALGIVGIEEKLADAVFRLKYANDSTGYLDALDGVVHLARRLNMEMKWHVRRKKTLRRMAFRVLNYWLAPNCPICTGVGYEMIKGSPHLSDRTCPACHGERTRPMPWMETRMPREPGDIARDRKTRERWARYQRKVTRILRIREQHRDLLVALEIAERRVGDKVVTRLNSR